MRRETIGISHNADGPVDLGTHAHEWRQYFLARIAPQRYHAVYYVKLQRVNVLLVIVFF